MDQQVAFILAGLPSGERSLYDQIEQLIKTSETPYATRAAVSTLLSFPTETVDRVERGDLPDGTWDRKGITEKAVELGWTRFQYSSKAPVNKGGQNVEVETTVLNVKHAKKDIFQQYVSLVGQEEQGAMMIDTFLLSQEKALRKCFRGPRLRQYVESHYNEDGTRKIWAPQMLPETLVDLKAQSEEWTEFEKILNEADSATVMVHTMARSFDEGSGVIFASKGADEDLRIIQQSERSLEINRELRVDEQLDLKSKTSMCLFGTGNARGKFDRLFNKVKEETGKEKDGLPAWILVLGSGTRRNSGMVTACKSQYAGVPIIAVDSGMLPENSMPGVEYYHKSVEEFVFDDFPTLLGELGDDFLVFSDLALGSEVGALGADADTTNDLQDFAHSFISKSCRKFGHVLKFIASSKLFQSCDDNDSRRFATMHPNRLHNLETLVYLVEEGLALKNIIVARAKISADADKARMMYYDNGLGCGLMWVRASEALRTRTSIKPKRVSIVNDQPAVGPIRAMHPNVARRQNLEPPVVQPQLKNTETGQGAARAVVAPSQSRKFSVKASWDDLDQQPLGDHILQKILDCLGNELISGIQIARAQMYAIHKVPVANQLVPGTNSCPYGKNSQNKPGRVIQRELLDLPTHKVVGCSQILELFSVFGFSQTTPASRVAAYLIELNQSKNIFKFSINDEGLWVLSLIESG